jgi:hypothetical protein
MSDPTGDALAGAHAALATEQEETERLEQELLDRIAQGVPTAVDGIARRASESQPEITRRLGSDGISAMRKELADNAVALATEIRSARSEISWPVENSVRYGEVATRHVDAALFGWLHGRRMDTLAEVLRTSGFATRGKDGEGAQDLVNPRDLYSEGWLAPVAEALSISAAAESRVQVAQQRDDDATVRSIWDGSQK